MAFENDPEGYRMARQYAGADFDKARVSGQETLCEYVGEWSIAEFRKMVDDAIAAVPFEYRDIARVDLDGGDGGSLRIIYVAPETPSQVAARVKRCEEHVAKKRSSERAEFERLRAKYRGSN